MDTSLLAIMNCLVCEKEIKHYNKNPKYCSRACFQKIIVRSREKGEKSPFWKSVITENRLRELYLIKKKSTSEIGRELNVSALAVKRRLRLWNIQERSSGEQISLSHKQGKGMQIIPTSQKGNRKIYLRTAKENFVWVCQKCGKDRTNPNFDLIVHHKDRNNRNNEISNLMILCQNCHARLHKLEDENKGV